MGFGFKDLARPVAGAYSGLIKGGKAKQPAGPDLGGTKSPKFAMRKTEEFMKNDPAEQIGGPNGASALARRYENLRTRTSQDANAAVGGATDALKRRFASLGASGSGSAIKLEQQAMEAGQQQKADAIQQINDAEQAEVSNRDLAQADMNFKQKVFNFEKGSKMHELDMAERQMQIDSTSTEFNKRLAAFQAQPPKQGIISSILGDIL